MERPVQITLRNVPQSDALEAHIREKTASMEKFHPRITGYQVVVEIPHKHKHQGNLFDVRLDIRVPGEEIVLNREQAEDVYVALRDVFDAARRRLEDHARRMRGEVKLHAEPARGRVARLFAEEGYGFIETPAGDEYYFHRDNVVSPGFDDLREGADVHFIADMSADTPQAKRVSAGRHPAAAQE